MEATVNQNLKRKREKNKTNKRWADAETTMLLEYLQEQQQNFEKPTAQVFYRIFIKKTGIDTSWDLVRWKVKNLKKSFIKAESWRNSTGAGLLETDEGIFDVQDKLRKMCRFYDELQIIFGPKNSEFSFKGFDSEITTNLEFNSTYATDNSLNEQTEFKCFEGIDELCSTPVVQYTISGAVKTEDKYAKVQESSLGRLSLTPTPTSSYIRYNSQQKNEAVREFAAGSKSSEPQTTLDQLSLIQSERSAFLKLNIAFEKEKFKKEFALKERLFEEQVKERKEKFELKKLEIEKEERLRVLEIEKQERIERFQIEMHYKYGIQK